MIKKIRWYVFIELVKNMRGIKKLCENYKMDCEKCPLGNELNQCKLFEKQPWEWKIPTDEKIKEIEEGQTVREE